MWLHRTIIEQRQAEDLYAAGTELPSGASISPNVPRRVRVVNGEIRPLARFGLIDRSHRSLRRATRRWPNPRRHPSPASSVPRNRSVTCRHATSRGQRHSAHSTACRAVWLYAPGFLNLVQPPQVAPASRSKLASNPRSVPLEALARSGCHVGKFTHTRVGVDSVLVPLWIDKEEHPAAPRQGSRVFSFAGETSPVASGMG